MAPSRVDGGVASTSLRKQLYSLLLLAVLVSVGSVSCLFADIAGVTLTTPSLGPGIYPRNVAAAPNGNVWFTDERYTPHKVGYFTPAGDVKVFDIPCDGCQDASRITYIETITAGPDGNAWFAYTRVASDGSPLDNGMNNYIGRMTPAGAFTAFAVPTQWAFRRFTIGALGHSCITTGPDGNLWFTENVGHKIGRITTDGNLTEFALPGGTSFPANPSPVKTDWPSGIITGPDGNLWFTIGYTSRIGRMTPAGTETEFQLPANSSPYAIAAGPDGNLWFTAAQKIGRITPAGVVTLFSLPGEFPLHIVAGPDGNLWFTTNGQNLARLQLPVPASGTPVIDRLTVKPNYPFDITFTKGLSSIKSVARVEMRDGDAVVSSASAPVTPDAPIAEALTARAAAEGTRRRAVSPPLVPYSGRVALKFVMTLDDATRAALQEDPTPLNGSGITMSAEGLVFPERPAIGYLVTIGGQTVMTSTDGTFRLPYKPAAGTVARVTSSNGDFATSFRTDDYMFPGGIVQKPVVLNITLSSAPNLMNGASTPATTMAAGDAQNPIPLFGCGDHANCRPASCPSDRCCLDYNGLCADGKRWDNKNKDTTCGLRLQQFIDSTCFYWVLQGCCTNEGALTNGLGENGPGCYDNHRGRECQQLDPTKLGLQFTAGEHAENPNPPDIKAVGVEEDTPTVETVDVPCGGTSQFYLHNNTCANETYVQLNDVLSNALFCVAGGSITPSGYVKHYSGISESPVSTESTGMFRHINDQIITYTAPKSIGGSCDQKGTDMISAIAGGRMRFIAVKVDCSKGVPSTTQTIPPPSMSPSPGIYTAPVDVVVTSSTDGGEIHYTTDGTIPTILSPTVANGGTIHVDGSRTVRARVFVRAKAQSGAVGGGNYDIWPVVNVTVVQPPAGKLECKPYVQKLNAVPAGNNTRISVTLDGSEPSEASATPATDSSTSVTINPPGPVTLKARAYRAFYVSGPTTQQTYTFDCPPEVAGVFDLWMSASDPQFNDLLLRAHVVPPK